MATYTAGCRRRCVVLTLLATLAVSQTSATLTTSAPSPVLLQPRQSDFNLGSYIISVGGSVISEVTAAIVSAADATSSSSTPTSTSATTTSTSSTTSSTTSSSTTSSSTTSSQVTSSTTSSTTSSATTTSQTTSTDTSSNSLSSTSAAQQSDQAQSTASSPKHHGISGSELGIILGVVLGVVALIFLILLCLCCLRRRGKKRARRNQLNQIEAEKGNHFHHEKAPLAHDGTQMHNTHSSPFHHQPQQAHHHNGPSPIWLSKFNRRPSQRTPGLDRHPALAHDRYDTRQQHGLGPQNELNQHGMGQHNAMGEAQRSSSFNRGRRDPLVPVVNPAELSDTSSTHAANARTNGAGRLSQDNQATAPLLGNGQQHPNALLPGSQPRDHAHGPPPAAKGAVVGAAGGVMAARRSGDRPGLSQHPGPMHEMSRPHGGGAPTHERSSSDQSYSTPPMGPVSMAPPGRNSTSQQRQHDLNPFISQDRETEQEHLVSPILPQSTNTSRRSRGSAGETYFPSENEGPNGAPMFSRQNPSMGRRFGGKYRQRYYSNSGGERGYPYEGT